jgi:hypothetical protein
MIIETTNGKTKLTLTDKQMSVLMSALAAATVNWEELKDPEVTTTKADLLELSTYVLMQTLK